MCQEGNQTGAEKKKYYSITLLSDRDGANLAQAERVVRRVLSK